MKNVERRDRQLPYISDAEVMEQQMNARRLTQKLNTIDRSDFDGIAAIVKELFGKSEGAFVNPPFYCDYGFHIEVGKNFFANYNCTILDVAKVKIGDNCQMAPNVAIYTAGHPVHPAARNSAYEYGIEVTIGDNVWIGGNTVILPGVHIGDNVVIGGGSVVTKDIPLVLIINCYFPESHFSLAFHNSGKERILFQHLLCMVRNLRPAKPDLCFRTDFMIFCNQILYD